MKAGRIAGAIFLFGLALILGCAGLYQWVMQPPPPAPDLAQRVRPEPPPVVTHTAPASAPPEDLERCPLQVTVLDMADNPVEGALVKPVFFVEIDGEGETFKHKGARTDAEGVAGFSDGPCGGVAVAVLHEGYARAKELVEDTAEVSEVTVYLLSGVLIDGRVTDADGAPVEGAEVAFREWQKTTDEDGAYELWVTPGVPGDVTARKDGYLTDRREVRLPEEGGVTLDFTLERLRQVAVFCAGLPDDDCLGIEPGVLCTRADFFFGAPCDMSPTICTCPEGAAAVRGGGKSARVPEGAEEVWLDFRDEGGVRGRVVRDGEPVEVCKLEVLRVPRGLVEDVARGVLVGRNSGCEEDGTFEVYGMIDGRWRLNIMSLGLEQTIPELVLSGDMIDLGDIELLAGGAIAGRLYDGLTGDTLRSEAVYAAPVRDGVLTMPDGAYNVVAVRDPLGAVEVELVDEGEVWVELELWGDAFEEDQGLSLVSGGAGELVVDAVPEESPAAAAGLQPGDVISDVKLFGLQLSTLHPRLSSAALRYYSGPGMALVVDRGGEAVEIDLE